jgi:hypothetical protein
MATTYVRRFDLKNSLSDSEVVSFWNFMTQEFLPACNKLSGLRSARMYSGQGALRADLRIVLDLDNAAVYENLLLDPGLRAMIGRFYGALDLRTSTQTWLREITPELIRAIGS